MKHKNLIDFIQHVLDNFPSDWLGLTTHRLDIYNEEKAKVEFIDELEKFYQANTYDTASLANLPTAYDYIRLGHPLSSLLEWAIAKLNGIQSDQIIAFSSNVMPIYAVLRTNKLKGIKTRLTYINNLPDNLNVDLLRRVYGYDFELTKVQSVGNISAFDGQTVFLTHDTDFEWTMNPSIDFYVNILDGLGSVITINSKSKSEDISAIQHVRRRESIAMTPSDCLKVLQAFVGVGIENNSDNKYYLPQVEDEIRQVTHTSTKPLVGSSGLSIQYAIMMGLIDNARTTYPNKPIKIIVPPNCYGGTNDQARRVAASIDQVDVMDLPVDGDNDMVKSTELVLQQTAEVLFTLCSSAKISSSV